VRSLRQSTGLLVNALAIVVSATLVAWPIAAMAQVKVLMSGGFSGAYEQLLPEFERTSGIKVTTHRRERGHRRSALSSQMASQQMW
jgi:molybdate transport system substrate-binding protein